MRTGVPEVIVLEARAAIGTLRASEPVNFAEFLQLEDRSGIKPSGARVA